MKIEGSVALVTGANRGLGKAHVEALRAAGAAKVYAGAREPFDVTDSRVIPSRRTKGARASDRGSTWRSDVASASNYG
jgi:NAD(P)-dependent dehydrogenase (short-subunit alcohol dehydrogenase family)